MLNSAYNAEPESIPIVGALKVVLGATLHSQKMPTIEHQLGISIGLMTV